MVDDGSSDHTEDVVNAANENIRFLHQENSGASAARNLGAAYAQGDYLAFLDSDDIWFPWTLQIASDLIEAHTPAVLSGALFPFEQESELTNIQASEPNADVYADYFESCMPGCFVGAGMAFIKRDAFLGSGGFTTDIVNCEDHDLMLKLGTEQGFVNIKSPPTIAWRRHAGSTTNNCQLSLNGVKHLLQSECEGRYPGGSDRRHARRQIINSHVRPVSLDCLRGQLTSEAWQLYRTTLSWHIQQRRVKYLLGFPMRYLQRQLSGEAS